MTTTGASSRRPSCRSTAQAIEALERYGTGQARRPASSWTIARASPSRSRERLEGPIMGRTRKRFLIALAVTAPTMALLASLAPTPGMVVCSVTNETGHVLTSVHFEVEDRTEVIARIEPGET